MLFTELKNYVVFDLEMNGSNQIIEIGCSYARFTDRFFSAL